MKKRTIRISFTVIITALAAVLVFLIIPKNNDETSINNKQVFLDELQLSSPVFTGGQALNDVLKNRRSIREYDETALTEAELSQLLWSASGISDPVTDFRTAPSAGALYPLELYVAVSNVEGINSGLYKYSPQNHSLYLIINKDLRQEIYEAGLRQKWIKDSACVFVYTAVFDRTSRVYGNRASRYVYIELGHSAQNLYLQSEALSLGTVAIGAFDDNKLKNILNLPKEEDPVYIMPVGRKLNP